MLSIPLTKGLVAWVDDQDAGLLEFHWRASGKKGAEYASNHQLGLMHRHIMGNPPHPLHVDHEDGDHLNNRRGNLRVLTPSENGLNRAQARVDSHTGLLGVGIHRKSGLYRARFRGEHLGYFKTAELAYAARLAREKIHGIAPRRAAEHG